jgi:hypothetical protein
VAPFYLFGFHTICILFGATPNFQLTLAHRPLKGYGVETFPNGDKVIRMHEGKPVGKGHWKGTWRIVKGTGTREGVKAEGTWDSYSMGQGQPSYMEVEGEMEMPGQ